MRKVFRPTTRSASKSPTLLAFQVTLGHRYVGHVSVDSSNVNFANGKEKERFYDWLATSVRTRMRLGATLSLIE